MGFKTGKARFDYPNPSTGLGNTEAQGFYIKMTAGENIANFSVVCIYIDGRAHLADADSSVYMPAIAMNTTGGTISSGAQGDFLIFGIVRNTAWAFTIGKPIYVDPATDGVISSTMPTTASECVQVVGYAISPESFVFNPSPDFVVLK